MGRPVNKRKFGLLDDGTNFTVNCQVGTNTESQTGYIIKQKSSRKFLVNDLKNGTKVTPSGSGTGNVGVCLLVDKADGDLGENEMSIVGYVSGGSQVRIKKLFNRTCVGFNNVRYKYTIDNDSTASLLTLTAI